ncbi:aminomethyltransferase family protein [Sphingobium quisquiliarum]|uniref:aminomethyltransferase family protein n=1 Tax=Sphingobium quisquiliarum TaxID=538379 RepID=UPI00191BFFAC|nr:aminomethyltransferase family protein [Sphingobium quisquiliarum]
MEGKLLHWRLELARRIPCQGRRCAEIPVDHAINSFAKFDLGQAKHAVFCNKAGKVIGEGVLQRLGEDEFEFQARGPVVKWLEYRLAKGGYSAAYATSISKFKFQVSGPAALAVCEKATGEPLRDIGFMRFRSAPIRDVDVLFLRQGMAGEIGFELQGPSEKAEIVRQAILEAGADMGIRQLGSRTAMINHLEAAFPTVTHDYLPAVGDEPEREFYELYGSATPVFGSPEWFRSFARTQKVKGSYEGRSVTDWYRSPIELGWAKSIKFDHDFYGREALEAEMTDIKRVRRTLIWNKQDVVDVFASLFEEETPYDYMEFPRHQWNAMYANKVMDGDRLVGVATSRGYSYYFRKMLSHVVIDTAYAEPGTELTVIWGEPGHRQKAIRVTVAQSPFKQDNRRADLNSQA